MAKRTTVRRFDTEEVQGEGSFVVLSSLKVKEVRRLHKLTDVKEGEEEPDAFEEGVKMLANHIVDWDWVDDDGNPLPKPKGKISVIDMLTNEESEFISDLLVQANAKQSGESKSKSQ